MATLVHFDSKIGEEFLRYARLVANRGYIHNTLGNMVIRTAHPDHSYGVAYTKHAEVSLEEMGIENIVITEIPTSKVIYGSRTTSIGHNLSREILRLRADIGAVIHVHDDATISFFGSGAFREVKVLSLSTCPSSSAKTLTICPQTWTWRPTLGRSRSSLPIPTSSYFWGTVSLRSAGQSRRPIIASTHSRPRSVATSQPSTSLA